MNVVACYCEGCVNNTACLADPAARPRDVSRRLLPIETQTGGRVEQQAALEKAARAILEKCTEGSLVAIAVPAEHRAGTHLEDAELWAAGEFMLVQIAEMPSSGAKRTGTRSRGAVSFRFFRPYPQAASEAAGGGAQESIYRFPSSEVCRGDADEIISEGECSCNKKHYTEAPIHLLRHGSFLPEDLAVAAAASTLAPAPVSARRSSARIMNRSTAALHHQLRRRGSVEDVTDRAREEVLQITPGVRQQLRQVFADHKRRYPSMYLG